MENRLVYPILMGKKYYSGFIQKPVRPAEQLKARSSGMSFEILKKRIPLF
jgi:hypothetical protein